MPAAADTPHDLEAEYNNRARVPEHPAIIKGWARDAAAYRARATAELSVAYEPGPRRYVDLFFPGRGAGSEIGRPVVLFVHGGYWQGLDPSFFSHVAAGPTEHGSVVAVAGYDLCPEVTVAEIVRQVRQAVAFLWRRFRCPVVVCGHSAGGHLAAAMLATDWMAASADLPRRLVPAALAISGLFELEPLISTSVNRALGLDAAEARRLSPRFWPPPAGAVFDAWVGGLESAEYLRQTRETVADWAKAGVEASAVVVPDADHFTVIAPLADPRSAMTRRLASLVKFAEDAVRTA